MATSTPARWPLFGILSQWASVCAPQGARDVPDGSADLLPHMLKATGIDAARLPVATHDALAARCSDCSDKPHCAQELARNKAADSYAAFCPNAEAIRTLRGA